MPSPRFVNDRRYLSTADIARRAGLHPDTLRRLRRVGGGPPYVRVGRAIRYDVEEFDSWMQARTFRSQADELARGLDSWSA